MKSFPKILLVAITIAALLVSCNNQKQIEQEFQKIFTGAVNETTEKLSSVGQDALKKVQQQAVNYNQLNEGIVAVDGDYIYYVADAQRKLYRENIYDNGKELIFSESRKIGHLNVYDNWIYCTLTRSGENSGTLIRIKCDGSLQEEISLMENHDNIGWVQLSGDYLYYVDSYLNDGLYKINLQDFSQPVKIYDGLVSINIINDSIYGLEWNNPDVTERKIIKMDLNGENAQVVTSKHCTDFLVVGEYIYYTYYNYLTEFGSVNNIVEYDMRTQNETILWSGNDGSDMTYWDGNLYWCGRTGNTDFDNWFIYSMDSETKEIKEEIAFNLYRPLHLNLANNQLYYQKCQTSQTWPVRLLCRYVDNQSVILDEQNKESYSLNSHALLTGTIEPIKWTHAVSGDHTNYVLVLDKPIAISNEGNEIESNIDKWEFDGEKYINVSKIELFESNASSFVGQHVIAEGNLAANPGTAYYQNSFCLSEATVTPENMESTSVNSSDDTSKDSKSIWKKLYIDYIEEKGQDDTCQYQILYIDNDDIPELLVMGGSYAAGDDLCTVYNGQLNTIHVGNYGVSYIPQKNLVCASHGHMDAYDDTIYSIQNGQFVALHKGSYGAKDNAHVQFDETGKPIYQYYWDDREVSESEYKRELNAVFDKSLSLSPYTDLCTDSQIIDIIKNS